MFRLQFKFGKRGILRFLSHLEVARALERALRRAGFPLVFSQGFSPHPRISFGPALPVGVSSRGEYADVLLSSKVEPSHFVEVMNQVLSPELELSGARYVDLSAPSLQSLIGLATYEVEAELFGAAEDVEEQIAAFLSEKEIIAARKEGGPGQNILPYIHHLNVLDYKGRTIRFQMGIKSLEKGSLKPEVAIKAFARFSGYSLGTTLIERTGLFTSSENMRGLW